LNCKIKHLVVSSYFVSAWPSEDIKSSSGRERNLKMAHGEQLHRSHRAHTFFTKMKIFLEGDICYASGRNASEISTTLGTLCACCSHLSRNKHNHRGAAKETAAQARDSRAKQAQAQAQAAFA
jgi:hypothetical protein